MPIRVRDWEAALAAYDAASREYAVMQAIVVRRLSEGDTPTASERAAVERARDKLKDARRLLLAGVL
jgi:hypothetical protein